MSDLTRKEQFLNYIAHPNDTCPDPMTREEYLLKEIAEHKDEPSGAQLPNPTESDKGKFAHVNSESGELEYAEVDALPTVETTDKDKYLHTNAETGELEWAEASGLPPVTAADKNKTLRTNSSTGSPEWGLADGYWYLSFNADYSNLTSQDGLTIGDIANNISIVFLSSTTTGGGYPDMGSMVFDVAYTQINRSDWSQKKIVIRNRSNGDLWETAFAAPTTTLSFTKVVTTP